MGAVYLARRIDSEEEFAIKLIKRGMDTDSILRRFHTERHILETLHHPNIAEVLDAGATPEGLPYFVMEHIPGQPISQYCDSRKLSIEERLRLFQKVCSAVQCAHESPRGAPGHQARKHPRHGGRRAQAPGFRDRQGSRHGRAHRRTSRSR